MKRILLALTLALALCSAASAEVVAVAAGIAPCVEEIMDSYVQQGGSPLEMVKASCGVLAKQIEAGAPYRLLLLSEPRWPQWLKKKGFLPQPQAFARGKLVLWNPGPDLPDLADMKGTYAVPKPETTAYGMLAKEYLQKKGLWEPLVAEKRLIFVGNAPQSVMAVRNGAATAGFIPRSMALKSGGSAVPVPGMVIDQVGGLLKGYGPEAKSFWDFCHSPQAAPIWVKWGFEAVTPR